MPFRKTVNFEWNDFTTFCALEFAAAPKHLRLKELEHMRVELREKERELANQALMGETGSTFVVGKLKGR